MIYKKCNYIFNILYQTTLSFASHGYHPYSAAVTPPRTYPQLDLFYASVLHATLQFLHHAIPSKNTLMHSGAMSFSHKSGMVRLAAGRAGNIVSIDGTSTSFPQLDKKACKKTLLVGAAGR